ncbi:hypothetical protein [Bradyrhizobium sp. STM 3557]|uniref:hypothetical protein n=1 Tax=Bradyrhizobium sp. STM 3557 TaxID=578920 RepID=UPI00388FAA39
MLIITAYEFIKRYAHYRSELACIAALDDRTLYDIGHSRTELCALAWRRAGLAAH